MNFYLKSSDLQSQRFPLDQTSDLHIEFLSSINQLKLGGRLLINCSSSDGTPVQWYTKLKPGIQIQDSYLSIAKFSSKHFDYYYCRNSRAQKILRLSSQLFDLANQRKPTIQKHNISFIEIQQGKYVGDNITLVCHDGRGR